AAGQADRAPVRFAFELDDELARREGMVLADRRSRRGRARPRAEQREQGRQRGSQSQFDPHRVHCRFHFEHARRPEVPGGILLHSWWSAGGISLSKMRRRTSAAWTWPWPRRGGPRSTAT